MRVTKAEIKAADGEHAYWTKVGKIIGIRLFGWTLKHSASFEETKNRSSIHIDGIVAEVLLKQQKRIKELENQINGY